MFYSKETLFAEFDVATKKDQSKKKEIYDNRIQFFKDHIELRKTNPQYYDGVDVNFTNLLEAWSAPSPRDHFYMKVFGKTYADKMAESEFDKWAEAESQKDEYLRGTVVSDSSDSPFLAHPGEFPGEETK